jgi:PPK2 family polyphosphate:nucleotide phosphotransferase
MVVPVQPARTEGPRRNAMLPSEIVRKFRVKDGEGFRLSDYDPADTLGFDIEKEDARALLTLGVKRLRDLQEKLYAQARWSLLIVLQAMDAAGKDSAIEHVMSGINPQGCEVHAFKAPSQTELRHDFLWRHAVALPERGRIGIFNRSYYEEVLVVRVHPALLANQRLSPELVTDDIWRERFDDICAFERHLSRSGTAVLKFFLHVSKDEQRRRFLQRIEEPEKRWKFAPGDLDERQLFDQYMEAYEDMIRHTASKHASWHVVPADHKWFSRLVIVAAIVDQLERLDPKFPAVDEAALKEMEKARQQLLAEDSKASRKTRQDR